jgi:hypothetical protein
MKHIILSTGLILLFVAEAHSQINGGHIYISSGSFVSSGTGTGSNTGTQWATNRSNVYGAFRFPGSATANAADDAHAVNGYVSRLGTSAFSFPTGDQNGTDLRVLTISAPALATDHLSIAYWKGNVGTALDPTGGAHSRAALNPAGIPGSTQLVSVSPIGFWDWVPVNGRPLLNISVSIPDFSGPDGYTTAADMRLAGWNTSTGQWDNLSGSTGAGANTENTIMTGTVSNMSMYSAIGIGSVSDIPLSISFSSALKVRSEHCNVYLTWSVVGEQGISAYDIERSSNGRDWQTIGSLKINGNNQTQKEYAYTDPVPDAGSKYYRLKIAELSADYSYSAVSGINISGCNTEPFRFSPNPSKGMIQVSGTAAGDILQVYNVQGQSLMRQPMKGNSCKLDLAGNAPGIYHLVLVRRSGATEKASLILQ